MRRRPVEVSLVVGDETNSLELLEQQGAKGKIGVPRFASSSVRLITNLMVSSNSTQLTIDGKIMGKRIGRGGRHLWASTAGSSCSSTEKSWRGINLWQTSHDPRVPLLVRPNQIM